MKTILAAATLGAACTWAHAGIVATTRAASAAEPAASAASSGMNITLPSMAGKGDPVAAARPADDVNALNQAAVLIGARQPQAAIDRYLDPLIARLDAQYRDDSQTLYCANTTSEAVLYMLKATSAGTKASATDGSWCNAYFERGFAQIDLGRLAAAEADFARALALSPDNPHYLSEMGELQTRKRDFAGALGYFHRAEEAAKAFAVEGQAIAEQGRALRGIGYADVELGKLDEAEAMYRRCLELDPHDQKAQAELGYVLDLRARRAGAAK